MTEVPSSLIEALRSSYGESVADVARASNIELGATPPGPADPLSCDPHPYTLAPDQYEMFRAVARGLADIFSRYNEQMNDPHRWDPKNL